MGYYNSFQWRGSARPLLEKAAALSFGAPANITAPRRWRPVRASRLLQVRNSK